MALLRETACVVVVIVVVVVAAAAVVVVVVASSVGMSLSTSRWDELATRGYSTPCGGLRKMRTEREKCPSSSRRFQHIDSYKCCPDSKGEQRVQGLKLKHRLSILLHSE